MEGKKLGKLKRRKEEKKRGKKYSKI